MSIHEINNQLLRLAFKYQLNGKHTLSSLIFNTVTQHFWQAFSQSVGAFYPNESKTLLTNRIWNTKREFADIINTSMHGSTYISHDDCQMWCCLETGAGSWQNEKLTSVHRHIFTRWVMVSVSFDGRWHFIPRSQQATSLGTSIYKCLCHGYEGTEQFSWRQFLCRSHHLKCLFKNHFPNSHH